MKIGNFNIENRAVLAPMAGFCDIVMRKVADDFNAGFTVSEMVSARALRFKDKKSHALMQSFDRKHPFGIQLFGFEPEDFKSAVPMVLEYKPDFIDINMGCPAPKITGNGSGSSLMKDPMLAKEIAKVTVETAKDTPVSVKMRKGWDNNSITAIELAKHLEEVGVSFLAVHGRTRMEMYKPGVDYDIIKEVKNSVSIPVFANGDITNIEICDMVLNKTNCDGVMIGREALSRPWFFNQLDDYFKNKPIRKDLTVEERMSLMLWHIEKLCEVNGEVLGMKKSRGQAALYLKGLKSAAHLRFLTNSLTRFEDAKNLVLEALKENSDV